VALTRFEPAVLALAEALRARGWRIACAESCTGGLLAAACTAVAGSSDWFERGVVSYSNEAKTTLLGVPAALIAAHGAVSEEVARAMAEGLLARAPVDLAVAVTGIAGPGGAVPGKPVGLVHFAVAARDGRIAHREQRFGAIGRSNVRQRSVVEALRMLLEAARGPKPAAKVKREAATDVHKRVARSPRRVAAKRPQPKRPVKKKT